MKDLFKRECDLRVRPIDLNYVLKQVSYLLLLVASDPLNNILQIFWERILVEVPHHGKQKKE